MRTEYKGGSITFAIFTEILIVVGIIISITLTAMIADTAAERVITLIAGWFVWGSGLFLRIKSGK